jgi:hypothetical protein
MSDNHGASCSRDTPLENFAAELTSAAYSVALRHGMAGSWIRVELGLWRVNLGRPPRGKGIPIEGPSAPDP